MSHSQTFPFTFQSRMQRVPSARNDINNEGRLQFTNALRKHGVKFCVNCCIVPSKQNHQISRFLFNDICYISVPYPASSWFLLFAGYGFPDSHSRNLAKSLDQRLSIRCPRRRLSGSTFSERGTWSFKMAYSRQFESACFAVVRNMQTTISSRE